VALSKLDYFPIAPLLPVEDVTNVHKWHRFISPDNNELLYSLIAKLYVSDGLEIVVHRSFIEAMREVIDRKAVRGHDYVIFSMLQEDGWYIHARIDRHFISEEDVINE
jgi:hypothetical protein